MCSSRKDPGGRLFAPLRLGGISRSGAIAHRGWITPRLASAGGCRLVELAVPSRIESMPGLVTRRRLDGGGGVVGREVAWSREAGDVTDRAKIIAAPIGPMPRMSHRLVPEAATAAGSVSSRLASGLRTCRCRRPALGDHYPLPCHLVGDIDPLEQGIRLGDKRVQPGPDGGT